MKNCYFIPECQFICNFNMHFYVKKVLPFILFATYIFLYHAYVIGFLLVDPWLSFYEVIIYQLFFNILYYLMIWSTLATIFQPLPTVPDTFRLTTTEIRFYNHRTIEKKAQILAHLYDQKNILMITRTPHGNFRYCGPEFQFKPDRAHHCSQCGFCILKMDHHCQWLNTCICFTNQKGFILNLFYTFCVCLFYVCSAFNMFVRFWTVYDKYAKYYYGGIIGKYNATPGSFIIAACLGTVTGVFFMFHMGLIIRNRTLIEDVMEPTFQSGNETYDLGTLLNIGHVFGYTIMFWFVPIFNQEGDGTFFPTRRIRRRKDELAAEANRHKVERNFSDFVR